MCSVCIVELYATVNSVTILHKNAFMVNFHFSTAAVQVCSYFITQLASNILPNITKDEMGLLQHDLKCKQQITDCKTLASPRCKRNSCDITNVHYGQSPLSQTMFTWNLSHKTN